MSTTARTFSSTVHSDVVTRRRVGLLAVVLGVTAVAAIPAGVLWPEGTGDGQTYLYADIAPIRNLWWGLLMFLSVLQVLNVPAQALATILLVRGRGATWATIGGCLMWLGSGLQAAGIAAMASTYFFPTDPDLDHNVSATMISQINHDSTHVFAVIIPGAILVLVGTVVQAVGLFRSHAVPTWLPIASLAIVATFVVSGNGWAGTLTSLPMAAAAIGLGYFAWRRFADAATEDMPS